MKICGVRGCSETENLMINSRQGNKIYYVCRPHAAARRRKWAHTGNNMQRQVEMNRRYLAKKRKAMA